MGAIWTAPLASKGALLDFDPYMVKWKDKDALFPDTPQAMFYIEYGLAQVAAARSGAPGLVCEGVTPPRSRSRNAIDSRRRSTGMAFPRSPAPDDSGRTDR